MDNISKKNRKLPKGHHQFKVYPQGSRTLTNDILDQKKNCRSLWQRVRLLYGKITNFD